MSSSDYDRGFADAVALIGEPWQLVPEFGQFLLLIVGRWVDALVMRPGEPKQALLIGQVPQEAQGILPPSQPLFLLLCRIDPKEQGRGRSAKARQGGGLPGDRSLRRHAQGRARAGAADCGRSHRPRARGGRGVMTTPKLLNMCDVVLDASDPDIGAQLREAIGAAPGDTIEIVTPQFERTPGMQAPTGIPSDWKALRGFSVAELKSLGCSPWDEPNADGKVLMLFPGEWFDAIPSGYSLVSINGLRFGFDKKHTDNDIRFGCLSFGIQGGVRHGIRNR